MPLDTNKLRFKNCKFWFKKSKKNKCIQKSRNKNLDAVQFTFKHATIIPQGVNAEMDVSLSHFQLVQKKKKERKVTFAELTLIMITMIMIMMVTAIFKCLLNTSLSSTHV